MNSYKVSIIVPIYNVASKIQKGLDSLVTQTYKNIEILLINDGSKDDSLTVCQSFADKDKRIYVFDKENSGAGETRNLGLDHATGDFVMFMDADDWYESKMVEYMLSLINSDDKLDSVCCGRFFERQLNDGSTSTSLEKAINIPNENFIFDDVTGYIACLEASRRFPYLWDKIYRREIIECHHIRFEKQFVTGQDNDFNMKYLRFIRKGMITNEYLYHYVKDGVGSLCAKYKKDLYHMVCELNRRKYVLFNELGMFENQEYYKIFANSYISYLHTCIPNMFRKNANISLKEKHRLIQNIFEDVNIKKFLPYYQTDQKIRKIFKWLLKTNSPWFAIIVYSFLFYIRNHSEYYYQLLK